MAKRYDLLFETSRFNLSQPKDYFINDCCYGDDAAAWLRGKLAEKGIEATEPDQEDWGWYIDMHHDGNAYFVGVGGNADDEQSGNRGEWRLMVEKHRSIKDKLTGKNQMTENDGVIGILRRIIENEPDMKFLRVE
jgi:hypothetical protein